MKNYKIVFLALIPLLFISCGSNDAGTQSNGTPPAQNNSDINDTIVNGDVDAEIVKKAAIKINNLTVNVHENTYTTTSRMYKDVNRSLQSLEQMSGKMVAMLDENMKTLDTGMKLLNSLAKPFEITSNYTSTFSLNSSYTASVPAFSITKTLTDKYFIMSSTSKLFLQTKTIKKYFYDPSSLAQGWSEIITAADTSKDLYLSILQINNDGSTIRVTNSFLIKASKLSNF